MNETTIRTCLYISLGVLAVVCAVFAWLYVSENTAAGKLAEDYSATTAELDLKIGELEAERDERRKLDVRYRSLEQRYHDLGESIPGFTDGLSDIESGLGGVASSIYTTRAGLQADIAGLSELAEEIGTAIEEAEK